MSDEVIAAIARDLAEAMTLRARTRHADDNKLVLDLQTRLCAAVRAELEQANDDLAKPTN
jgi:hypothetical protein